MKSTGYIRLIIILIIAAASPALAVDAAHFRLCIFMDRTHFYSDEKVQLRMCVENISAEQHEFVIFEKPGYSGPVYTTFQPVLYDSRGREAATRITYRLASTPLSEVIAGLEKRVIRLAPGEVFVRTMDLNELYEIVPDRDYRVRAFFYPDLKENIVIKADNMLGLKVTEAGKMVKKEARAVVQRALSPTEIIHLALHAEKSGKWDNCIKFINVEKYINSYPDFVQRYSSADIVEKVEIEDEFITFLSRKRYDYLLDFRVEKEDIDINGRTASVEVIVDRYNVKRTDRYLYRYRLERYRDMWLITSLDATVMKGIKK